MVDYFKDVPGIDEGLGKIKSLERGELPSGIAFGKKRGGKTPKAVASEMFNALKKKMDPIIDKYDKSISLNVRREVYKELADQMTGFWRGFGGHSK